MSQNLTNNQILLKECIK